MSDQANLSVVISAGYVPADISLNKRVEMAAHAIQERDDDPTPATDQRVKELLDNLALRMEHEGLWSIETPRWRAHLVTVDYGVSAVLEDKD